MARPISKITSSILSLKKAGQKVAMPPNAKQATIASYVYNANSRMGYNNLFSTTTEKVKGRKRVVVVRNQIAA